MDYMLGIIWNEANLDCFEVALCSGAQMSKNLGTTSKFSAPGMVTKQVHIVCPLMLVSTVQNLDSRETWRPVFMHARDYCVYFEGNQKEHKKFRLVDSDPRLKNSIVPECEAGVIPTEERI